MFDFQPSPPWTVVHRGREMSRVASRKSDTYDKQQGPPFTFHNRPALTHMSRSVGYTGKYLVIPVYRRFTGGSIKRSPEPE